MRLSLVSSSSLPCCFRSRVGDSCTVTNPSLYNIHSLVPLHQANNLVDNLTVNSLQLTSDLNVPSVSCWDPDWCSLSNSVFGLRAPEYLQAFHAVRQLCASSLHAASKWKTFPLSLLGDSSHPLWLFKAVLLIKPLDATTGRIRGSFCHILQASTTLTIRYIISMYGVAKLQHLMPYQVPSR